MSFLTTAKRETKNNRATLGPEEVTVLGLENVEVHVVSTHEDRTR